MTPEERRIYQKEWSRAHYLENKEKILARGKEWRKNNPEKCRAMTRAWRKRNIERARELGRKHARKRRESGVAQRRLAVFYEKNPGYRKAYARNYRITRIYGISQEELQRMVDRQGGKCPICLGTPAVIDHCHRTGVVRGFLCSPCNSGLGYFRENEGSLLRAIDYLASFRRSPLDPPNRKG